MAPRKLSEEQLERKRERERERQRAKRAVASPEEQAAKAREALRNRSEEQREKKRERERERLREKRAALTDQQLATKRERDRTYRAAKRSQTETSRTRPDPEDDANAGAPEGSTDTSVKTTEAAPKKQSPARTEKLPPEATPTAPPETPTPEAEATPAETTLSPTTASDDAEDAVEQSSPTSVGRRGPRGRRSRGRSLDAPPSPKTRKRKSSTIPDGEWLPGTWPAGHAGGSNHAISSGLGVGVGVMETEQLIAEIERRPGIYDSGCPQYQDRLAKWTLWCEVCEIMTPRWHHLAEDRKAARVKELQKRWKSLRDSFMKELKLQREMQRTGQTANRKKYVFFDQMTFLMPCLEARGDRGLRTGGLILREVDPYESETDSSKADRDGGDPADLTDCHSNDAPVNLSTANGSGLSSGLNSGLGSGLSSGLSGLASIGGLAGLSSLAGHSVLGSATAVTAVTGGSAASGDSQPDDDRGPLMLTTATTTTTTTGCNSDRGKYRPPSGQAAASDWKRRCSGTPLNPYEDDEEDPDGDRLFLLSLAPSLRSLRGAAKSALKIELAQLVHKTLYEPDDALADSMTESLAPVISLAEGSPASSTQSTQSECGTCGNGSAKCTCTCRPGRTSSTSNSVPTTAASNITSVPLPLPLPLSLPLALPLSLPRVLPGLSSPKRARPSRHIGIDFSNFNGHAASKVHGV